MKNKELIQKIGTPIYVYEKNKIIDNCNRLKNSIDYENKEVHYAVMCNNNKEILKLIKDLGLSVQINSLYELELVKKLEFDKNKISFTSIGLDNKLLKKLISKDIQINLDSLEEVEKYCKLNPGGNFGIRVKMKENI